MKASSGRASIASSAWGSLERSAPWSPRPGGSPPSWRMRASMVSGVGSEGGCQRSQAVVGSGGHEGHRPGEDCCVGLGVGGAADSDEGLADDVVEGEGAGVDRVAAEDRAEGEVGAVALGCGLRPGRWRSARRRAGRSSRRPGWRRGCRGSRRRGRGRSSSWRAGRARGRWSSASGRRSRAPGGPLPELGSRRLSGRRWMPVISAPDIVVGIAATRAPVTEAIAFAVSITRPPPRATRFGARAEPSRAAAVAGTAVPGSAGGSSWTATAALVRSAATSRFAPGRQQLEWLHAVLGEQPGCAAHSTVAKDDDAAGVAPDEVAAHSAETVRGLTTGRRFGSTSARRCS